MNRVHFSKYHLLWVVNKVLRRAIESTIVSTSILLMAMLIILFSSLYLVGYSKKLSHANNGRQSNLDLATPFMQEFIKTKLNENDLIHNILGVYDHIDVKKLSNTNIYKKDKKLLYSKTNVSVYFDATTTEAQKIAATVLNISPLIVLDNINFSRSNSHNDNNDWINVKMDLTLVTNRSFKV